MRESALGQGRCCPAGGREGAARGVVPARQARGGRWRGPGRSGRPWKVRLSPAIPGMRRGGSCRGRPPPGGTARGTAAQRDGDGDAAAAGGAVPPGPPAAPGRGGRRYFTASGSFKFLRSLSASELPGGGAPRGGGEGGGDGAGRVKRRQLNDSGCSPRPYPGGGPAARHWTPLPASLARLLTTGHGGERGRGVRLPGGVRRSSAMGRGEASVVPLVYYPLVTPGPLLMGRLSRSSPFFPPRQAGVLLHPLHGQGGRTLPWGCPVVGQELQGRGSQTSFLCQQLQAAIFRRYRKSLRRYVFTVSPLPPSPKSKLKAGVAILLSLRLVISCHLINYFSSVCSEAVWIKGTLLPVSKEIRTESNLKLQ